MGNIMRLYIKAKQTLKLAFFIFLRAASYIIPKKQSLVLFGARNGDYYMDNSRDLFEWMLEHQRDVEVVWMTRSRAVYQQLSERSIPVEKLDSLRGILLLFRSRVAIYSNTLLDFSLHWALVPKSVKALCLGHGAPIKNYRFTIKSGIKGEFLKNLKRASKVTNFAIASSAFIAKLDSKCQQIDFLKYHITGYPRNDRILKPTTSMKNWWGNFIGESQYQSILLYAPTWRKEGEEQTKFFPFEDFDIDSLLEYLKVHKILLLMRPHIKDLENNQSFMKFKQLMDKEDSHIKLATSNEVVDVNDILPFIDVLITDYSSIMTDFLLLDNPIMFFPYDFKEFDAVNGFVYDYYKYLPGPAIQSFEGFKQHLDQLMLGVDDYASKRHEMTQLSYEFVDSNACERVSNLIVKSLKDQ